MSGKVLDAPPVAGGNPPVAGDPVPPAGDKPAGAPGDTGKPVDPPAVPDKYDVKLPDGVKLDEKAFATFSELAKADKLSNDQVQKYTDLYAQMQAGETAARTAAFEEWRSASFAEVQADRELGGANFEATRAAVHAALSRFDPKGEVSALLVQSGLDRRIEFVRMFNLIDQRTREDKVPGTGGGAPPSGEKSIANRMWPDLPK